MFVSRENTDITSLQAFTARDLKDSRYGEHSLRHCLLLSSGTEDTGMMALHATYRYMLLAGLHLRDGAARDRNTQDLVRLGREWAMRVVVNDFRKPGAGPKFDNI